MSDKIFITCRVKLKVPGDASFSGQNFRHFCPIRYL